MCAVPTGRGSFIRDIRTEREGKSRFDPRAQKEEEMLIIGEKVNVMMKKIGQAMKEYDKKPIQEMALLSSRGVDENLLRERSMITPSCGLEGVSEELAGKAYRTACELSRLLRGSPSGGDDVERGG